MPEPDNFIRHKKCSLHYVKVGSGEKKYLVFHGFGQDHSIAQLFPESGNNTYFIFDLFFHGKSEWNHGEDPLEKDLWVELIKQFLDKESINVYSLISFSMGSRFALTILESYPERVESNILIAPDGFKKSFWYWLGTYPFLTRRLFKAMINHPAFFRMIANTLRELYLLDKGLIRFAESQMNTPERRQRAYLSWVVFRHLNVKTATICKLVNDYHIQNTIIVGKNDKVITEKWTRNSPAASRIVSSPRAETR
jgi:pimeloyl-ACP methyl ester carboxylesterase